MLGGNVQITTSSGEQKMSHQECLVRVSICKWPTPGGRCDITMCRLQFANGWNQVQRSIVNQWMDLHRAKALPQEQVCPFPGLFLKQLLNMGI